MIRIKHYYNCPMQPQKVIRYNPLILIQSLLLFYVHHLPYYSISFILFKTPCDDIEVVYSNILHLVVTGAVIGLISGLTGIGGGIFLSPVLVLRGWTSARNAAGTSALFTLVNSIVGMAVVSSRAGSLPDGLWIWLLTAGLGAWIGSEIGVRGLSERAARRLLALVLCLAAMRSLWAALN